MDYMEVIDFFRFLWISGIQFDKFAPFSKMTEKTK
jgi:hypothetical protein